MQNVQRVFLSVAVAAVISACGRDDSSSSSDASVEAPKLVTVTDADAGAVRYGLSVGQASYTCSDGDAGFYDPFERDIYITILGGTFAGEMKDKPGTPAEDDPSTISLDVSSYHGIIDDNKVVSATSLVKEVNRDYGTVTAQRKMAAKLDGNRFYGVLRGEMIFVDAGITCYVSAEFEGSKY